MAYSAFASKVVPIDGKTLRWSQAAGLPFRCPRRPSCTCRRWNGRNPCGCRLRGSRPLSPAGSDLLRKDRRLGHIVRFGLAAEAAAEQRHMAGDVLPFWMPRAAATVSCTACGFWVAAWQTTLPSLNSATAAGGSIGRMRQQAAWCTRLRASSPPLAKAASTLPRLATTFAGFLRGLDQLFAVASAVIRRVGAGVPDDLQLLASLHRGPLCDRREPRRRPSGLEIVRHPEIGRWRSRPRTPGTFFASASSKRDELAPVYRRVLDGGDQHARHFGVDPEDRPCPRNCPSDG